LMNQVFAHLRVDLIRSMREIFRVLRPGGLLFLSSPNLRSFRALAQLIFRGDACAFMGSVHYNYSSLESHGFMGQIRVYTPKEIADFLTAMNFRVGGIIYRGKVHDGRLARFSNSAASVCPSFRPDFTLLAVRPE
jgi:2-polyprenyl-3-methyl-5-hydroxy-6-metoxy-1,4-benzoquinol methylase